MAEVKQTRIEEIEARLRLISSVGVAFLNLPDRDVRQTKETVRQATKELDDFSPTCVYLPEVIKEQTFYTHPDHLATGLIAETAAARHPARVVHRYYHSRQPNTLVDVQLSRGKSRRATVLQDPIQLAHWHSVSAQALRDRTVLAHAEVWQAGGRPLCGGVSTGRVVRAISSLSGKGPAPFFICQGDFMRSSQLGYAARLYRAKLLIPLDYSSRSRYSLCHSRDRHAGCYLLTPTVRLGVREIPDGSYHRGRDMRKFVVTTFAILSLVVLPRLAGAEPIVGTLDLSGNNVRVTGTTIDWFALGGTSGTIGVTGGTDYFGATGPYGSLIGQIDTLLDLDLATAPPGDRFDPIEEFQTVSNTGLDFTLTRIAKCGEGGIPQLCLAGVDSPFIFTPLGGGGSTVSLSMSGTVTDSNNPGFPSSWTGNFSADSPIAYTGHAEFVG